MTTFVVDDDPFALKMLSRQLAKLGCTPVETFEHALDALRLVEASDSAADLIFCDLQMPDVDGIEFVRNLARIGYQGGLVLVSGEDSRVVDAALRLAKAHNIAVLGALPKPVSVDKLQKILESNAGRRKLVPGSVRSSFEPAELERAILNGQLINHYQPQVLLSTGAFVGVETLVRWQHPVFGLVGPDQFISTAEEHGLIDDLTRVVLAEALKQTRVWQSEGLEVQMAVNISMNTLAALQFPDEVAVLAGEAAIELPILTLEVTESRLMTDVRAALDTLSRLRLKRISLSIDDFGTGHSSLVQLRDIPFNELKLDRSFISGAHLSSALTSIVDSTLTMARQLGMRSVAEGVEDRIDWDFIRGLGCDVAQGYFIGRPMPGNNLVAWLGDWDLRRGDLAPHGAPVVA